MAAVERAELIRIYFELGFQQKEILYSLAFITLLYILQAMQR